MKVRYIRIRMLSNYACDDDATRHYGALLYAGTTFEGRADWLTPVVECGAAGILSETERDCD